MKRLTESHYLCESLHTWPLLWKQPPPSTTKHHNKKNAGFVCMSRTLLAWNNCIRLASAQAAWSISIDTVSSHGWIAFWGKRHRNNASRSLSMEVNANCASSSSLSSPKLSRTVHQSSWSSREFQSDLFYLQYFWFLRYCVWSCWDLSLAWWFVWG